MDKGIYLILFIFWATLLQVILTISEEQSHKSWDLHIRKKRIIDKTPNGNQSTTLQQIPFIVHIHQNRVAHCGGSILTSDIIITAAHCVSESAVYTVISGSSHINLGVRHNVTGKLIHNSYNKRKRQYDLALLRISPAIDLIHSYNRKIELWEGNLPPHPTGTISGWGCNDESGPEKKYPFQLRSTVVPIYGYERCRFLRDYPFIISDENLCTHDKHNNKCASLGDTGGPLIYGNKLVGILIWTGTRLHPENPDVFIKISHPLIRNWIVTNVRIIQQHELLRLTTPK